MQEESNSHAVLAIVVSALVAIVIVLLGLLCKARRPAHASLVDEVASTVVEPPDVEYDGGCCICVGPQDVVIEVSR